MLDVEYRPGEIYLARIEICPEHQWRGAGTRLISALIDEARQRGQDLVLEVLTINQRAYDLYQRLGMNEEASNGDKLKLTMRSTRQRRVDRHM
jgi:ribosomal protein S18 acetylase RimI-like enzyme